MKSKTYISISEVSEILKIKQHVIRYWDSKFEGVSTRLGNRKRRVFNKKNIKKIETLKNLLHTNGRSHRSLELAKKIIGGRVIEKKFNYSEKNLKNFDINKLIDISNDLKKILK